MTCDVEMSLEDKIQFKVYITKKTIDSFKQFLSQKWQTYGRGLLSLEVEQALKQYISEGDGEHTHSSSVSGEVYNSHSIIGRKQKPRTTYSVKELDQLKVAALSVADLIDKKIKGERIEQDHKERVKASLFKDGIVEWLVSSGRYEDRDSIKQVPFSLLRQAISGLKNITDKRSVNNQIEYLKMHKQIDQIGINGKLYRFVG
jgi:hypothetical protein